MKRALDFIFASVGLIILALPMMVLIVLVRLKLGSPIFFRQVRPGLNGVPFEMVKFRTMTDARDEYGELLPDYVRLTSFGKFLRSSSLDELPELWNVIRGDMSLVGPRPLLMDYLKYYNSEQMRRHEVLPGITGWAQVNGRNAISWEEKFKLDVWYVDNKGHLLDLKIIIMTVKAVFKRSGINASENESMPFFKGSEKSQ